MIKIKFLDGTVREFETLVGVNLRGANLTYANLRGANLRGANLTYANLEGANLRGANLTRANLTYANLGGVNLEGVNLEGANLFRANLEGANLFRANLEGANLTGVLLWNTIGNGREVRTIQTERHMINLVGDRMQIGCKNYSIEEWFAFSDEEIRGMDPSALEWCKKYRTLIENAIKLRGMPKK